MLLQALSRRNWKRFITLSHSHSLTWPPRLRFHHLNWRIKNCINYNNNNNNNNFSSIMFSELPLTATSKTLTPTVLSQLSVWLVYYLQLQTYANTNFSTELNWTDWTERQTDTDTDRDTDSEQDSQSQHLQVAVFIGVKKRVLRTLDAFNSSLIHLTISWCCCCWWWWWWWCWCF